MAPWCRSLIQSSGSKPCWGGAASATHPTPGLYILHHHARSALLDVLQTVRAGPHRPQQASSLPPTEADMPPLAAALLHRFERSADVPR